MSDPRTDNLRTRIAKALWDFACPHALKADHPEPGKAFLQMADAVIRALELEVSVTSKSNDGRFKSFAVEGYWEEVENDD